MTMKKVSYIDLLKEAVNGYPTNPEVSDAQGPFVDNILSYTGDEELVTHKDASNILERYYFDKDEGIETFSETDEKAAGATYDKDIDATKKDIIKSVTEADDEEDDDDEVEDEEISETEQSIVEKLIEEMEEEDEEEDEEELDEAEDKSDNDKEEDDKEEDEEDLDVDKELEEWGTGIMEGDDDMDEELTESHPHGPADYNKSSGKKGENWDDESDVVAEQFELFKEQVENSDKSDDDVLDIESDDVIV